MKDFDFTPATSASDLTGHVLMPRGVASLSVWKKKPYDAAHALADLFVKANTEAGEWTNNRGLTIAYQAGWVIWTNKGLAEEWGWRRESVERFMVELEKSDIIRRHDVGQYGKVIELLDYVQPDGHRTDTERTPNGQPDGHRTDTVGDGVYGEGEGEAPPRPITLEMAVKFCEENGAGYSRAEIAEQWGYYDATRDPQTGMWQRQGRAGVCIPISDWRSELSRALAKFTTGPSSFADASLIGGQKKNGTGVASRIALEQEAKKLRAAVENHPVRPDTDTDLNQLSNERLAELRADLKAKKARLKQLDEQLAEGIE
jgi:hypothetical protein